MSGNKKFTHIYTGEKHSGDYYNPNYDVKALNVDNSITVIKEQTFKYCSNLTSIEMHNNITSIEPYAFSNCDRLQAITIPSSVKTIVICVFVGCECLETVSVLPSTIIHPKAFHNCDHLSYESKSQTFISTQRHTLSESFQKGDGPTLNFQGATQNGYSPEMWGLTLLQIKLIYKYPKIKSHTTMRQVVELAVKPMTNCLGIGYTLLVNRKKPLHAKVMVSVS